MNAKPAPPPANPTPPRPAARPQLNIADPGNELRDMIEDLRALARPLPSQADVVRRVVREAWERECGGKVKFSTVDRAALRPTFLDDLKDATKGKRRK